MPISRYSSEDMWREAVRDLEQKDKLESIIFFERDYLVNRVTEEVGTLFYPVCSASYMTPVVLLPNTTGKYLTSGGTWNATTGVLSGAFDVALDANDNGKELMFRVGVSVYPVYVQQVLTTTSLIASGVVPSSNGTVNEAMIASTRLDSDGIYIGNLSIMRTGGQFQLELESTQTDYLKPFSLPELRTFRPSMHTTTIAWALSGDYIILRKGDSLDTYGTLVLRYPRIPLKVAGPTHKVDIPDGVVLNIGIERLKQLIVNRYSAGVAMDPAQLARMMKDAFATFGVSKSEQELVEQVRSQN